MNFDEWFKTEIIRNRDFPSDISKSAWNACKKEVLKILNKHKITLINLDNINNDEDTEDLFINYDVIKEIEKL